MPKTVDNWNPIISCICSNNFCENDFMSDLKAELLGSTPKKLKKSDDLPTQDVDQVEIQSDSISTSGINHCSRMEHEAIEQPKDQNITTVEESRPSTPTHTSDPELTAEAIYEEFGELCKKYEAFTNENKRVKEEFIDCYNTNINLRFELEQSKHAINTLKLKSEESDRKARVQYRNLKLFLKRGEELKKIYFSHDK